METVSQVGSKTRTALTYLLDELIRLKEDNEFSSRYVTHYDTSKCFPGGSAGKESACNPGDLGLIPGLRNHMEKEKATHFSILAWRIPWTV